MNLSFISENHCTFSAINYFTGNHEYADFVHQTNLSEIYFRTSESFRRYEENETDSKFTNNIIFECESSINRILVIFSFFFYFEH